MFNMFFSGMVNNLFNQNSFLGKEVDNMVNQVFTGIMNNQNVINDVVDSVLNSDVINTLINSFEEFELNLLDYQDRYLIEGKLPGVNKKDIDIDYEKDHLKIKIARNQSFNTSNDNIVMSVYRQGTDYEKEFYVPNVDSTSIKAVFNSEMLRIYLRKNQEIDEKTVIIDVDNFTSN